MKPRLFAPMDFVLIALLAVFGFTSLFFGTSGERGYWIEITSPAGNMRHPVGDHREVNVEGPLGVTVVKVEDNAVSITSSPCPLKICIKEGEIDKTGQTLVCLPNRVAVTLAGDTGGKGGVDAVAQ